MLMLMFMYVWGINSAYFFSSMKKVLPIAIMNSYLLCLFLLFLSCFTSFLRACNQVDHDSLLSFSLDLTMQDLDWSSSNDCCSWEGIGCNDDESHVTRLSLPQRGLTGRISPFLGNLTHLSFLNLSHNYLSGPLPVELFSLCSLERLDLSNNRLTGSLPLSLPLKFIETLDLSSNDFHGEISSSVFRLTERLTSLNVRNNGFTGFLPSSICTNLAGSSVQFLDFSNNGFSGEIPLGFGECSSLRVLLASHNDLTGPIPSDIYHVASLQVLCLHVNHLSGPISPRITQLEDLYYLELRNNLLNGSIPENIGRLSNLQSLLLQSNNLTGHLPQSLMNCTNLIALILRVNHLEGNISLFDFSKFSKLRLLDLGNNKFTGILPPSIYSCKSLQAIRFSGNHLEGQISSEILGLNSLTHLSLSNNKLTNITGAVRLLAGCKNLTALLLCGNFINETLPDDEQLVNPDEFKVLRSFALCGCNVTGQVPAWLANLKTLRFLDISDNHLTGAVPGWLGSLPELSYLNLSANSLSGEIPKELFNLQALELGQISLDLPMFLMPNCVISWQYNSLANIKPAIYLSGNRLTGKIPAEVGQLKFLHILDLSQNEFYGEIPDEISQLTSLETLDISRNNLSGEIPPSFVRLNFLSRFSVANNNLTGPVPSGGQFHTFPPASFEGNPGICGSILQRKCNHEQPKTDKDDGNDDFDMLESSELRFGIVAGVIFGFIIGCTIGALSPTSKFKILRKIVQKENTGSSKSFSINHGGRTVAGVAHTTTGFSGWSY